MNSRDKLREGVEVKIKNFFVKLLGFAVGKFHLFRLRKIPGEREKYDKQLIN